MSRYSTKRFNTREGRFPNRFGVTRLLAWGVIAKSLLMGIVLSLYSPLVPAMDAELPTIGSSDASLLTQAHEHKVAEQVMRNLRQANLILEDPELNEYIQNLGHRLSSQVADTDTNFNFFIIRDLEVNAFALPAGYIAVHAGLFLTTRSEDELASVLAHEIAHVSQRHYSRNYEISNQQNVILAAAIIAAIALGRQDSSASSALIMGGMANSITTSLAFSREHEQEADRLGIQLLARSGFNADAMPKFFERMEQATRYNSSSAPEYVRTHPVTLNRISEAKDRAAELKDNHHKSSQEYELLWHKLATLVSEKNRLRYKPPVARYPGTEQYAHALSLAEAGHYAKAITAIDGAIKRSPNQALMRTEQARIYLESQQNARAVELYAHLYALYPSQASIALGYGKALLNNKQADIAKRVLRKSLDDSTVALPQLYRLLADTEMQLGNQAASHRYLSDYYFNIGNPYAASRQIEIALEQKNLSFYEKEELEARFKTLQDHLQLLAKLPEP